MKNTNKQIEECIIIGMGPAGITAAIYLSRLNVKPLCIEENKIANKLYQLPLIANYPGFTGTGSDLAQLFNKQIESNKIKIVKTRVSTIQPDENCYRVQCEDGIYYGKTLLISVGVRPSPLTIPGAISFSYRGISRCAICDGPLFKNKDVAVYGDKATAIHEALYLSEIVNKLYFICPNDKITADEEMIQELEKQKNVKIFYNYKIKSATGTKTLEELCIKNSSEEKTLSVRGLFLYIGEANNAVFLPFPEVFDNRNFIIVDEQKMTKIPGIFAAGDITTTPLRQVVTACGDGAIAAISIKNYLKSERK